MENRKKEKKIRVQYIQLNFQFNCKFAYHHGVVDEVHAALGRDVELDLVGQVGVVGLEAGDVAGPGHAHPGVAEREVLGVVVAGDVGSQR